MSHAYTFSAGNSVMLIPGSCEALGVPQLNKYYLIVRESMDVALGEQ
jgi:hypothetical protein